MTLYSLMKLCVLQSFDYILAIPFLCNQNVTRNSPCFYLISTKHNCTLLWIFLKLKHHIQILVYVPSI